MTINVFLVDDHPTFRDGLRVALDDSGEIRVVGEADTGEEAVSVLPRLDPAADVVLMDVKLAGCSGITTTRLITSEDSAPAVLVLSAADDDDVIVGAIRAGAKGFIDKSVSRDDLLSGVRLVANGGAAFTERTAARLGSYFSAVQRLPQRLAFPELTDREIQILDLLARGRDNRGIARELVLAEKTVRNNITSIFAKLNVADRTAAVVRARDAGMGLDGTGPG
jgi:DNA-binding NarL/FixJ family response regulator